MSIIRWLNKDFFKMVVEMQSGSVWTCRASRWVAVGAAAGIIYWWLK